MSRASDVWERIKTPVPYTEWFYQQLLQFSAERPELFNWNSKFTARQRVEFFYEWLEKKYAK